MSQLYVTEYVNQNAQIYRFSLILKQPFHEWPRINHARALLIARADLGFYLIYIYIYAKKLTTPFHR